MPLKKPSKIEAPEEKTFYVRAKCYAQQNKNNIGTLATLTTTYYLYHKFPV